MLGDGRQRLLGVELAPQDERRGQAQPEREVREAPGVEHRRGDHRALARVQRDLRQQRRRRVQRLGLAARRALRRAGRARGEDHDLPRLGGRHHIGRVAALDQLLERRVVELGASASCQPMKRLRRTAASRDQVGELLVEDDRARAPRA